jgi:hypothetical protein
VTRLVLLDGPATAAVRDQLVAVYRAAMGAAPFHETEVETGWFAVVWIAVHPDRRGRGIGRELLERLLAGAGSDRAWLVTHDLDTPARTLYRSLGFHHLGHGPLGWHHANRVVLGTNLPPGSSPPTRRSRLPTPSRPGVPHPNPPLLGPLLGG